MVEEPRIEIRTPDSDQHHNFGRYCLIILVFHGNINFTKNSYKNKLVFDNIPFPLIPMD